MKTKILLALLSLSTVITGFCTTVTINNASNSFSPNSVSIIYGDSVKFLIAGSHDAREVDLTTWSTNGNTALSGGFQTAFGGGIVLPAQLAVGTHYFVCSPHASMGMKGIITVQACTTPSTPGSINGSTTVCEAVTSTYNVFPVSGAASYTWTLPGGWTGTSTTNSIIATPGPTGGNISVIANSNCGSSSAQTLAVTVNTPPAAPGAISGNTTVCPSSSNTYSISTVSGAISYSWTMPSGWSGASTSNSITLTSNTTSGNITVTASNTCGPSAAQTLAVTVNTAPAVPGTITGSTAVCAGTSNTYSILAVTGATSYTWTLPGGWTGTSATNSIVATASSTSGNITVTADNVCGSSTAQILAVIVHTTAPATPGPIVGNTTICESSSNIYSISPVSGATSYTWTLPVGWTGTSTTNSISAVASSTSGNISVTANNACGASAVQTLNVTISGGSALPQPGPITGNDTICSGSTNTYSITPISGATSYIWTLPLGWTGSSTADSIIVVANSTSGNITVSANNTCGSSSPQTLAVIVNTAPASSGAIAGSTTVCRGTPNTYSILAINGAASYTWTLPSGWAGTSVINSIITIPGVTSGNITVTATNSCGSSATQTLNVTVNTVDTSVSRSGTTLTANASGALYQWINCSTNIPVLGQIAQSYTPAIDGTYAVIVEKNGCIDTSSCHNISTVGIVEISSAMDLTIYPNPSTGKLKLSIINSQFMKNSTVEIYNIQGKKVYQSSITLSEIDLSDQPKGTYLMKINEGQKILMKRIVLQ